jgi:hypothetical protein
LRKLSQGFLSELTVRYSFREPAKDAKHHAVIVAVGGLATNSAAVKQLEILRPRRYGAENKHYNPQAYRVAHFTIWIADNRLSVKQFYSHHKICKGVGNACGDSEHPDADSVFDIITFPLA